MKSLKAITIKDALRSFESRTLADTINGNARAARGPAVAQPAPASRDPIGFTLTFRPSAPTNGAAAPSAQRPAAPSIPRPAAPAMAKTHAQTFGALIRERRRQLDFTQEELARQIETSVPYIGLLETDKRRPSDAVVSKLADALSLDRSDLFFLVNPDAKELLQQKPNNGDTAWEQFRTDDRLVKMHKVNQQEMEILSKVALMGEVREVRDFVYILNTVRQSLSG